MLRLSNNIDFIAMHAIAAMQNKNKVRPLAKTTFKRPCIQPPYARTRSTHKSAKHLTTRRIKTSYITIAIAATRATTKLMVALP
jgi:hypothetical protein